MEQNTTPAVLPSIVRSRSAASDHFGFNASNFEASRRFYFDLLGFCVTEPAGTGLFGQPVAVSGVKR